MLVCIDLASTDPLNLIDRRLHAALDGYTYDYLWRLVRRSKTAPTKGAVREFLLVDAEVSKQDRRQWLSILERCDSVIKSKTFKREFPRFADVRSWLDVVLRLSWESERIGCEPIAKYFDFENGSSHVAVLRGLNEWTAWLGGKFQLPRGGHLLFLPNDIRQCSSLAIETLLSTTERSRGAEAAGDAKSTLNLGRATSPGNAASSMVRCARVNGGNGKCSRHR
jgi:hypothetical protein